MPDGVLAREIEGVGRHVDGRDRDLVRGHAPGAQANGQGDRDGATPRSDVDDAQGLGRSRPGPCREPGHDLRQHEVDDVLGLGSRDERPLVDGQRDAVELLDPADVGDRLPVGATGKRRPERRLGVGPDGRLTVRHDGRPFDADRVRQQQLGIESRRFEAGRSKAVDPLVEQRARRRHRGEAIRAGS